MAIFSDFRAKPQEERDQERHDESCALYVTHNVYHKLQNAHGMSILRK